MIYLNHGATFILDDLVIVIVIVFEPTVPRSGSRMPMEVKRRREGGKQANLSLDDYMMIT